MKHNVTLLIKYTAISAVLLMILGIFQSSSVPRILFISLLITGVACLLGDLFILPRYWNTIATISDFGLSFVGIWVLTLLVAEIDISLARHIGASVFLAAVIIGMAEIFFHIYMKKVVLDKEKGLRESNEFVDYSRIKRNINLEK
ncbi:YndM family protein [Bacillus cereus]|uniref:YndM family protein n=1 Tax=Bacillus cereus TaxID=1396 RepID=UPI000B5E51BE|nr:YndM family protein [Bacillus cereus]ASL62604.1 Integral membrane protein [Bacillus cereus]